MRRFSLLQMSAVLAASLTLLSTNALADAEGEAALAKLGEKSKGKTQIVVSGRVTSAIGDKESEYAMTVSFDQKSEKIFVSMEKGGRKQGVLCDGEKALIWHNSRDGGAEGTVRAREKNKIDVIPTGATWSPHAWMLSPVVDSLFGFSATNKLFEAHKVGRPASSKEESLEWFELKMREDAPKVYEHSVFRKGTKTLGIDSKTGWVRNFSILVEAEGERPAVKIELAVEEQFFKVKDESVFKISEEMIESLKETAADK